MIFKLLTIVIVLFLVYIVFFKKNREKDMEDKSKKYEEITDTLVECPNCGVFTSKDDAILSSGKYFCSQECIK